MNIFYGLDLRGGYSWIAPKYVAWWISLDLSTVILGDLHSPVVKHPLWPGLDPGYKHVVRNWGLVQCRCVLFFWVLLFPPPQKPMGSADSSVVRVLDS